VYYYKCQVLSRYLVYINPINGVIKQSGTSMISKVKWKTEISCLPGSTDNEHCTWVCRYFCNLNDFAAVFFYSIPWVHIPEHSGHPFHVNLDSDSISFWTPIPFESGH